MTTDNYSSLSLGDIPFLEGGYISAWASPIGHFSAIKKPDYTNNEIGGIYIIKESHEWLTGYEPISLLVKLDSIEGDGESVGDIGGARMMWQPKLFLIGDGAIIEENLYNLLTEEFIFFVRDGLNAGQFIQFGCKDSPSEVLKKNSKSGNISGGMKGHELTIRSFYRFFYKGIIPAMDTIFSPLLGDDGFFLTTDDGRPLIA